MPSFTYVYQDGFRRAVRVLGRAVTPSVSAAVTAVVPMGLA